MTGRPLHPIIPPPEIGTVRNPGCRYCKHYLNPKTAGRMDGACIINANAMKKKRRGVKYLKWINCENPRIKNVINRCKDFNMRHLALRFLTLFYKACVSPLIPFGRSTIQEKCAFVDEDWMNL